ncbi:inositol monophosphatase family protein [Vibrio barjaei]|uniref:Inositol monophosphatase family protein n=1 Tax=Vibrio barjaei TaxID=1676683 RepID=A0ABW7IDF1_9VIBR
MKYLREFELAKRLAIDVGIFLNNQVHKRIDSEVGKDIKLELDRIAEEMIIDAISLEFDNPILSEEIGLTRKNKPNEEYWVIDPIDGTLNFSRDNPLCCISIALWVEKEPIFGVIYDFNREELFSGYIGSGAWLNDTKLEPKNKKEKSQSILATGFPTYMNDDEETLKSFISNIQEYKKIRMMGSAALSLAYVASGRFDSYIENNIKLWDVAAGIAINKALNNKVNIMYLQDYSTNTLVETS